MPCGQPPFPQMGGVLGEVSIGSALTIIKGQRYIYPGRGSYTSPEAQHRHVESLPESPDMGGKFIYKSSPGFRIVTQFRPLQTPAQTPRPPPQSTNDTPGRDRLPLSSTMLIRWPVGDYVGAISLRIGA